MVVVAGIDVSKATLAGDFSFERYCGSFLEQRNGHLQVAQTSGALGRDQGGVRVHPWA